MGQNYHKAVDTLGSISPTPRNNNREKLPDGYADVDEANCLLGPPGGVHSNRRADLQEPVMASIVISLANLLGTPKLPWPRPCAMTGMQGCMQPYSGVVQWCTVVFPRFAILREPSCTCRPTQQVDVSSRGDGLALVYPLCDSCFAGPAT